jgi:hypothetical protein
MGPIRSMTRLGSQGLHAADLLPQMIDMIRKKVLDDRRSDGAAVVLARVQRVKLHSPGSRSEALVFKLRVDQVLSGSSPSLLAAWCYTSGKTCGKTALLLEVKRPTLERGRCYVVAVERAPKVWPAPYALVDVVPVAEGSEAEAVEAHLAVLRSVDAAR